MLNDNISGIYNQAVICQSSLINTSELGEELNNFFIWLMAN